MNKITDYRQLHYMNHQSSIAWMMIKHKTKITEQKETYIYYSLLHLESKWQLCIVLSLNNSPKYVSQSIGSTIIQNYNIFLQNSRTFLSS